MVRLWAFLRSRRLAIILLVVVTVFAWVVTLVPLTSLDPAAAAAWDVRHPLLAVVAGALGLHRAYSSPVFLAIVALLTASTAACAWERTRASLHGWGAQRQVSPSAEKRLLASPRTVIELSDQVDGETALAQASAALRRLRMRTLREGDLLQGSSGRLGLLGSPLFHWALVGLFLFVAAGQLTRYQGYANLVIGQSVQDAPETYAVHLARGVLLPDSGFTGATITLTDLDRAHTADGVARGSAARVRVTKGSSAKEQWVYPNQPLRLGALFIQRSVSGPAMVATVNDVRTSDSRRVVLYYDEHSRDPRRFTLSDPATVGTLTVEVTPLGGQRVGVVVTGASRGATQTVGVGQVATLAEGVDMTVDALTYYSQLQVVNDWSVPWVYAMFALGIAGVVLTTFVPPRTIRVLVVEGPAGLRVHITTAQRRNDPAFPRLAEQALRDGLSAKADIDTTTAPQREGTE